MYRLKNLDDHVTEMRSFGEFLMPYNFPQVKAEEEDDVNHIKSREVYVDGYNLIIHYSKSQYESHYLETLQILGKYSPFLPFLLVCKVGKRFLGDKYLSLVEIFRENRKIYCWTVVLSIDGKPTQGPYPSKGTETCIYEGFEYRFMTPSQVNFY